MKKIIFSLTGGMIIGLILSFIFGDYQVLTYEIIEQAGINRSVSEIDFNFIFKASLLSFTISILIYLIWNSFDKRKHERFLEEFNHDK